MKKLTGIDLEQRTVQEAQYIIKHIATMRECAKKFNVSHNTIYKDIHLRLRFIDIDMYLQVLNVLSYNDSVKQSRGAMTRNKVIIFKENKNDR